MTEIKKKIQQEMASQKYDDLRERIKERSGSLPEKCPKCGYHICMCMCPNCEICNGSGYVIINPYLKVTDRDFGKVNTCPNRAKVLAKIKADEAKPLCGLTEQEIKDMAWEMVLPGISDAYKALPLVKEAVYRGYGMGLMFGTWGQGKTLLMKIAVAQYTRVGKNARYVKVIKLLDDIRTAYNAQDSMVALVNKIREWESLDLLCLDEMGVDAETKWAEDRLRDLLDERWVGGVREKQLTILAANIKDVKELPGYLKSRIEDNRFAMLDKAGKSAAFTVYLNGPDGRKSMPKGNRY